MPVRHGTLEHTADLGLWVWAPSLPELLAGAVRALGGLTVPGPPPPAALWRPLELEAPDLPSLLVDLLNEAVYALDAEGLLALDLEVAELGETRLRGRLALAPLEPGRQGRGEPVKAVTYHQAQVRPDKGGWYGQVILDV